MVLDRTWYDTLVDDDGSGTTGSTWDKADVDSLMDAIDAALAAGGGTSLTLNQGAADTSILILESSDVVHGLSGAPSTNTFGSFTKTNGPTGGLDITGWAETGLDHSTLFLTGNQKDAAQTTKGTGNYGIVRIRTQVNTAGVGANGNMLSVDSNGTTRFILDADGDSHQDVGTAWTNYDFAEDVELLTALSVGVSMLDDPFRAAFGHLLERHRPILEQHRIVTFNDDGHHFINWSRAHMLVIGAVRQQAQKLANLEATVARLTRLIEG